MDSHESFIANGCNFSCNIKDWKIKGEGREKFVFNQTIFKPDKKTFFELDLSDSGGSIFLWDEQGRLVLWKEGKK